MGELEFMPFKEKLDASQRHLRTLRELVGPPPTDRTWEDEYVAYMTEHAREVDRLRARRGCFWDYSYPTADNRGPRHVRIAREGRFWNRPLSSSTPRRHRWISGVETACTVLTFSDCLKTLSDVKTRSQIGQQGQVGSQL